MRRIDAHRAGDRLNDLLELQADTPDRYVVTSGATVLGELSFQSGPIGEGMPNGISDETLIAALIDRLGIFQTGNTRCRENALAITKLEEALMWLQQRTRDRIRRQVEGTSQP